jgi:hypothetical protein
MSDPSSADREAVGVLPFSAAELTALRAAIDTIVPPDNMHGG